VKEINGDMALIMASDCKCEAILEFLIENDADVNVTNNVLFFCLNYVY
jgi:ankyrin repeat protein